MQPHTSCDAFSHIFHVTRDLVQGISVPESRLLVSYLLSVDVEQDGRIRPDEVLLHLRALPMTNSSTGKLYTEFIWCVRDDSFFHFCILACQQARHPFLSYWHVHGYLFRSSCPIEVPVLYLHLI